MPGGMGDWCWPIRQQVVEPDGEQTPASATCWPSSPTAPGFGARLQRGDQRQFLNLEGENRLLPARARKAVHLGGSQRRRAQDQLRRRSAGSIGSSEHGLIKWPKKPQEVYWRHVRADVRVPVYWEWMSDAPFDKMNANHRSPAASRMPEEYLPTAARLAAVPVAHLQCAEAGFDLYAFYYRDTVHTNSYTMENAVARRGGADGSVLLHHRHQCRRWPRQGAGQRRCGCGGNRIRPRVEGRLCLTEAIHPEGLGIAAMCGHWSDGMPMAKGKGVFFNDLLDLDRHHVSRSTSTLTSAPRSGLQNCHELASYSSALAVLTT